MSLCKAGSCFVTLLHITFQLPMFLKWDVHSRHVFQVWVAIGLGLLSVLCFWHFLWSPLCTEIIQNHIYKRKRLVTIDEVITWQPYEVVESTWPCYWTKDYFAIFITLSKTNVWLRKTYLGTETSKHSLQQLTIHQKCHHNMTLKSGMYRCNFRFWVKLQGPKLPFPAGQCN